MGVTPRDQAALEIANLLGQVVARLPLQADGRGTTANWRPAPGLPAGVYSARFGGGSTIRLVHLTP